MPPDVVQILRKAGLSDVLLSNVYSKPGYWAKMGNLQFAHSEHFGTYHPIKAEQFLTESQRYATSIGVGGMQRLAISISSGQSLRASGSVSTIPTKHSNDCNIRCKATAASFFETSSRMRWLQMLAQSSGLLTLTKSEMNCEDR